MVSLVGDILRYSPEITRTQPDGENLGLLFLRRMLVWMSCAVEAAGRWGGLEGFFRAVLRSMGASLKTG